jgi:cold shock CspA family protein
MEGKIQKFVLLKGYGFILQGFNTRLFFHVSEWKSQTAPRVGMLVTFDVAPPYKSGLLNQAVNVVPVKSVCGGPQ